MKRTAWTLAAFFSAMGSAACGSPPAPVAEPSAAPAPVEPAQEGVLQGLCEASAMIPWEGGYLVADNETKGQLFQFAADFSPKAPVALADPIDDIESLAPDGARLWVVGSQSANKDGEKKPKREKLGLLGQAALTPDLSVCAICATPGKAPNDGGLAVEGSAVVDGHLWLGLRGPLDGGKALLIDMGADGARAVAVTPVDLGGFGVREISPWKGGLLVVAGPVGDEAVAHRLYWMASPAAAPVLLPIELPAGTESIVVEADGAAVVVTDGSGKAGETCEKPSTWKRIRVPDPK